jgi:hypothetical protein
MSMNKALRYLTVTAVLTTSTLVLAAGPKTGIQLRAECYRELGYNRRDADKPRQTVILLVNECVARKQASGM